MKPLSGNQEILERAIEKAIENGFIPSEDGKSHGNKNVRKFDYHTFYSTHQLLFNHHFAKALWGNPGNNKFGDVVHAMGKITDGVLSGDLLEWEYHLQQMVIADDPIKYLGENLDD